MENNSEYVYGPHIGRVTTDITGRTHLELVRDIELITVNEGDTFVTFMTKVEI